MAAPSLKHYKVAASAVASTAVTVAPAVPAGRALVISKIVVVSGSVASNVDLFIGAVDVPSFVANGVLVGIREVYTETGLVAIAGEAVIVRVAQADNGITVSVHGQEVDN